MKIPSPLGSWAFQFVKAKGDSSSQCQLPECLFAPIHTFVSSIEIIVYILQIATTIKF